MKTKILVFILAVIMIFSVAACQKESTTDAAQDGTTKTDDSTKTTDSGSKSDESTQTDGKYPSYLNVDSKLPVIKEGMGEDIVLKMVTRRPGGGADWDKLWINAYIEEYMNIKFDVEQVVAEGWDARKSMMFSSGDLPDIIAYDAQLSTNELVTYGQIEGQLLAMNEYISPELTPNIIRWMERRPDTKAASTLPDGNIYSLPAIWNEKDEGGISRFFINTVWLDAVGMDIPTTLDGFIDMARAFKENDPAGVGADMVIPVGGGIDKKNIGGYILNAFGFVVGNTAYHEDNGYGLAPSTLNGEAVLPCGDEELFYQYLKTMNLLYEEGLLSSNFFIIDDTEIIAQLNNNQIGVYSDIVYASGIDTWADWDSVKPLTSEYNDTQVWNTRIAVDVGGFVICADTEYPELCLRFADAYYAEDASMLWIGPVDGTPEALGYLGNDPTTAVLDVSFDESKYPDGITDLWSYLMGYMGPLPFFGTFDMPENYIYYLENLKGIEYDAATMGIDPTGPEYQYRKTVRENCMPYSTYTYPGVYYIDEETALKVSDLEAVIKPYVKEQTALFISGERSLDEFGSYITELDAIGFDELEQIYRDIWTVYKGALE